jgi:hypothetical protein
MGLADGVKWLFGKSMTVGKVVPTPLPPPPPQKKTRAKKAKAENINPLADFGFSAEQIAQLEEANKKPAAKKKTKKAKTVKPELTPLEKEKAEATAKKEPWVTVKSVELDMDDIGSGSFDLDWNDYFIAKLVRAGYKGTDVEMVDQWFASICRNVLQENFEQAQADPDNRK